MFTQSLFTVGANVMTQAKPTIVNQFNQVNKPTGRTMPAMSAARPIGKTSAQVQMSFQPRSSAVQMSAQKSSFSISSSMNAPKTTNTCSSMNSQAKSFGLGYVANTSSFSFGNSSAVHSNINAISSKTNMRAGNTVMKAHSDSFMPEFSIKSSGGFSVQKNHLDNGFGAGKRGRMIKMAAASDLIAKSNNQDGLDEAIFFKKDLFKTNSSPWHDIETFTEDPVYINCVIEIKAGEKIKYEVATKQDYNPIVPDVKNGLVRTLEYKGDMDADNMFMFDGMPHAYGMIPKTFEDPTQKETVPISVIGESDKEMTEVGGDEDPIDIYLLSDRETKMGQYKCKVIGVIHFVDDGEIDYKIIAVDADYKDVDSINEVSDLKDHEAFSSAEDEIMNWLKYYKSVDNEGKALENPEKKFGKYIVDRATDSKEAMKVIKECRSYYDNIVNSEETQKKDDYKKLKWTTPTE